MNMLFIKHLFVGFMVSEILRVSVLRHCPYSVITVHTYKVYFPLIIIKNYN